MVRAPLPRVLLGCLGLLCFGRITDASLVNGSYYSVPQNLCVTLFTQGTTTTPYTFFGDWRGPLPPVGVDLVTNTLVFQLPKPVDTRRYTTEAVRYNLNTGSASDLKCGFCPYSAWPEEPWVEYRGVAGMRMSPTPMYGPCIDGDGSIDNRMTCVQHTALFPPAFCGEYFYPDQTQDPLQSFPNFYHAMVEGPTSGTDIRNADAYGNILEDPSDYALGKGSVLSALSAFKFVHNRSGATNQTLTAIIQAPYLSLPGEGGAEQWMKWAQHFCRPACHRDSLMQWAEIRPSDYGTDPTLWYLSRRTLLGVANKVIRCIKCPPYQTAYSWIAQNADGTWDPDRPTDARQVLVYKDCFPWFGSVPELIWNSVQQGLRFKGATQLNHSVATDGIYFPPSNYVYLGTPCPVNTYNDKCAHYFKYKGITTPTCTPCPPGHHTAGQSGACVLG